MVSGEEALQKLAAARGPPLRSLFHIHACVQGIDFGDPCAFMDVLLIEVRLTSDVWFGILPLGVLRLQSTAGAGISAVAACAPLVRR